MQYRQIPKTGEKISVLFGCMRLPELFRAIQEIFITVFFLFSHNTPQ